MPMYIGGVVSADAILERPGQVHSDDLVGCIHSVLVNGRPLNLSTALSSRGVSSTCPRGAKSPCTETEEVCGQGKCNDLWNSVSCQCGNNGLISPDCGISLQPISVSGGSYLEVRNMIIH